MAMVFLRAKTSFFISFLSLLVVPDIQVICPDLFKFAFQLFLHQPDYVSVMWYLGQIIILFWICLHVEQLHTTRCVLSVLDIAPLFCAHEQRFTRETYRECHVANLMVGVIKCLNQAFPLK